MSLSSNGFLSPLELSYVGRKGGNYLLHYTFTLPRWDEHLAQISRHYWMGRWFDLKNTPHGGFYGRRGSTQGNLFASDIRKVLGEMLLEWRDGVVISQLRIDFRYQVMTEWDLMEYKLEQLLFRRALSGLPEPEFLKSLDRARFVSQVKWMFWTSLDGFPQEFTDSVMSLVGDGIPWVDCLE